MVAYVLVVTTAFPIVLRFLQNLLKLSVYKLVLGTGKGGTSIWGKKFEDEIDESLRVCISSQQHSI